MKSKFTFILTLTFCIMFTISGKAQNVVFNTNNIGGVIEKGSVGLNACWILDSDIHRPRNTSNESRFAEIGVGSLRYPYGHLADNYLWDTPPFGGTLVSKVATLSQAPGIWSWCTNADKTMNDIMDFDEFMGICQRQNIKPLIVINALSYKYNNGPTYAELKTTAVEWVKYAKSRGYEVAFWQIGNEVDHHQDVLSLNEYVSLYGDFAAAMKAEDPTAIIGPGILYNTDYFNTVMSQFSNLVDYTSTHQYLFGASFNDYNGWLNHNGSDLNLNISRTQNAINNSSKPNLPILVTETNSFGNWAEKSPALFKGLSLFDMLITQQQYEDVAYQYIWNSHSPWGGENAIGGVSNTMFNNADNEITAIGKAAEILNTTVEERYMIPDNKVDGTTYSYGSYTPATDNMTLYFINKSTTTVPMDVRLDNYTISSTNYKRSLWTGTNQYDVNPSFTESGTISHTANGFTTSLPPHSLVVVELTQQNSPPLDTLRSFIDHVGSGVRMKSNNGGTDAITVNANDSNWLGIWDLIPADPGYYYIQNTANANRLQGTDYPLLQNEATITLVDMSFSGDWVQWKLTPVGSNYFIDNKAHNVRLFVNGNLEVSVGSMSWTGDWSQWNISNSCSSDIYVSNPETGEYHANQTVSSDGLVTAGTNVTYSASDNVLLDPNFEVGMSAIFCVELIGCN